MQIRQLPAFEASFRRIRDDNAQARILVALQRLAAGNAGDSKSLGGGLCEHRIHYGPGYRVYFTRDGAEIVLLLLCGSKATQVADIATARSLIR